MKYDRILIDTSNFYMRAYFVNQNLTAVMEDGTKMATGGIYTSLRMTQSLEKRFLAEDGKIYFLFDNCHSGNNRRKEIDPAYKSNRTKKDDSFYRSLDIFQMILLNYKDNYRCVKREGFEADDLVYPLVKSFRSGLKTLLISNDLDWFRAISENVHVAKYENGDYEIYDIEKFKEKLGFAPTESSMIMYKSFRGDTSDNIPPGLPGIRSKDLDYIVEHFDTIKELLMSLKDITELSDNLKEKIQDSYPRLSLNEKLVSYQPVTIEELKEDIYKCVFNPHTLHSLYTSLKFNTGNIDPRVAQFYAKMEEKDEDDGDFFKFDKIKRI